MDAISVSSIYVLALLVFFLCAARWINKRMNQRQQPPGPQAVPIIGHLHLMMKTGTPPHVMLQQLAQRYGPLMSLRFGSVAVIVASNSVAAKEFLKTHDAVFASRPSMATGRIIGYDSDLIFAPYGERWRQLRRLATLELLTARRIETFSRARIVDVKHLCESLLESSGSMVDLREKFMALTFNVITFMIMRKRYFGPNVQNQEEATRFIHVISDVFEVCGAYPLGDFFPYLRFMDPVERRMKRLAKSIDSFLETNISEHREKRRTNPEDMDFLDVMLNLRDQGEEHLQQNKLKGLVMNLVTAGTDTSSVTMEWALAEMIKHPDVLSKAQEETDRIVGPNRMITESDLPQLHYLQAVVKETLRLHPPVTTFPHLSMEDRSVLGYDIPGGTYLLVNLYAIGRDESIWEEPLNFNPERFVGSDIDVRGQDFGIIPFGAGRRMCPGLGLALITVQLTLANLVHGFNWEAPEVDTVSEKYGVSTVMAKKLEAIAIPRLSSDIYM